MGPLLFSHAIHPILGYLDDLTAGGDQHTVASDYLMIETIYKAAEMGLNLNVSKCEVITNDPHCLNSTFGGFNIMSPSEGTLLGAPLLDGSAMSQILPFWRRGASISVELWTGSTHQCSRRVGDPQELHICPEAPVHTEVFSNFWTPFARSVRPESTIRVEPASKYTRQWLELDPGQPSC